MNLLLSLVALLLLLALLGGMWRVAIGPSAADRLAAVQVLGTLGIGILMLLSILLDEPAARDTALLIAILSLVVTMAFLRRLAPRIPGEGDDA